MTIRFPLDPLRCIALEGKDAHAFAQSQFTADIERLAPACWSPLAWCDPGGRVLAFMMAEAGERRVDLALPASQAESIGKRLKQFTIGRDVRVTEPGNLVGSFDPAPAMPTLACDRSRSMARAESAGARPADEKALARWQHLDICQALPWLEPDSSQQHLPQWLGLEALGGLDYDKGCYPGQEVIARLHYRGSIKYRLRGVHMARSAPPPSHARITDGDGKPLGRWLRGLASGGETLGLAVVRAGLDDDAEVLVEIDGQALVARVTPAETLC